MTQASDFRDEKLEWFLPIFYVLNEDKPTKANIIHMQWSLINQIVWCGVIQRQVVSSNILQMACYTNYISNLICQMYDLDEDKHTKTNCCNYKNDPIAHQKNKFGQII